MSFMSVEEGERKKIGAAAALIDTFQAFQEAPKNKVSFKGNLCASCKSLLLLGSFSFVNFLARASTTRFPLHNGKIQVENYFFEL